MSNRSIPILKFSLGNVFPYYLRRVEGVTVLQSLMDKDLSVACYAKEMKAAAIVSNDSDMLIYAVCPGFIINRYLLILTFYNSYDCSWPRISPTSGSDRSPRRIL